MGEPKSNAGCYSRLSGTFVRNTAIVLQTGFRYRTFAEGIYGGLLTRWSLDKGQPSSQSSFDSRQLRAIERTEQALRVRLYVIQSLLCQFS